MIEQELIKTIFIQGRKIMIEYVNDEGVINKCGTEVEDLEESYLILKAPLVENRPLTFRESQELTLRLLDDHKDEAYLTNVFIIDICQGNKTLLICSKPQKIRKTSLRCYSRFDAAIPLKFSTENASGSGTVTDVSLRGCYAMIDPHISIDEGTILQMVLSLPNEEVILDGKIIRAENHPDSGKTGVAVDFRKTSDAIKESIYDYIFQIQMTAERLPED